MLLDQIVRDESGQTTLEYALVIGLVATAIVVVLAAGLPAGLFGSFWETVQAALP